MGQKVITFTLSPEQERIRGGWRGRQHPLAERSPEVTTVSGAELLHLVGATSLAEWSRAELSCNGSLEEEQDCYMPTGKPSRTRTEL